MLFFNINKLAKYKLYAFVLSIACLTIKQRYFDTIYCVIYSAKARIEIFLINILTFEPFDCFPPMPSLNPPQTSIHHQHQHGQSNNITEIYSTLCWPARAPSCRNFPRNGDQSVHRWEWSFCFCGRGNGFSVDWWLLHCTYVSVEAQNILGLVSFQIDL